jgi:Spy/CpxP family protein refolding chaperone
MKVLTWVAAAVVAAALCGSSAVLFAQDAKPAAAQEKKMKKEKAVRLTKPWNQIASLSDEQKAKINEIHKKAVEDRQAIDKREHEEAMAVLTEEQRTELAKMKEDEEVARKAKKGAGAKKSEEKAS